MRNPSSILIVFDEDIDIRLLHKKLSRLYPKSIDLFPLTSNWRLICDIKGTIQSLFGPDIGIKLIESAELIDKEVDVIRGQISKWSANFGNYKIAGKSLKEWFLLPKDEVSTWWFSLLSEKNSRKTNVFFRLAQLQAIDKTISSNSYDSSLLSVSDKVFFMSIGNICKKYFANMLYIASIKRKKSLMGKIKSYLNRQNAVNLILNALIHFIFRIIRAFRAKLAMRSIIIRAKKDGNSILFVSYFPAVDKKSAKNGILKNKYAIPLQEKLSDMNKKILWIWMYAFIDGNSYGDALILAKKFKKNGETNFFLEEFMSFKVLLRVVSHGIHQLRIYLKLKKLIPTQVFYENLSIPEGAVFIKNLMAQSFIGWTGLEGILFFELFKEVFSHLPYPSQCIYCSEMQAWEKALNAAKQLKAPHVKSIGYQHAAIFRNHFTYLNHPSEMNQKEKSKSLPLPNILGCNGDIPLLLMSHCRYPNLIKVEAIRHLYLTNYLINLNLSKKQNIVLIAGSLDMQATSALISLFYEAFPKPKKFKVWLKGHPALPFEKILRELRIETGNCGYIIKHDPIEELLKPVKILIVGISAVAIEGLAGGCKVISPLFSENMFISPLEGFEKFYTKVHNPQELRTAVEQTIQSNRNIQNFCEVKKFISRYWCLDLSLKRWEELLGEKQ